MKAVPSECIPEEVAVDRTLSFSPEELLDILSAASEKEVENLHFRTSTSPHRDSPLLMAYAVVTYEVLLHKRTYMPCGDSVSYLAKSLNEAQNYFYREAHPGMRLVSSFILKKRLAAYKKSSGLASLKPPLSDSEATYEEATITSATRKRPFSAEGEEIKGSYKRKKQENEPTKSEAQSWIPGEQAPKFLNEKGNSVPNDEQQPLIAGTEADPVFPRELQSDETVLRDSLDEREEPTITPGGNDDKRYPITKRSPDKEDSSYLSENRPLLLTSEHLGPLFVGETEASTTPGSTVDTQLGESDVTDLSNDVPDACKDPGEGTAETKGGSIHPESRSGNAEAFQ